MSRSRGWSDEVAIEVAAPPERLWRLIADVPRMGEWSPVCRRCEWIEGFASAAVGARFIGHTRQGPVRWSRVCEITTSDQDREFAFKTLFQGAEATRWRYRFESTSTGTRVTESYEVVSMPRWVQLLHRLPGMHAKARRDGLHNMTRTLDRLRTAAKRG
ncbi:MAG: SRPBCC family protein [Acidimicrobiia bacterium]|nr:SRPBCC family protein [Acidimicrobiia bacterium]